MSYSIQDAQETASTYSWSW